MSKGFFSMFQEPDGKWSIKRVVAFSWFLVVVASYLAAQVKRLPMPEAWDQLTYVFFTTYALVELGGQYIKRSKDA